MSDYNLLVRVCIFADEKARKNLMLSKFFNKSFFEDTKLKLGIDFYSTILELKGEVIKLQLWDISFHDEFKKLLRFYLRGTLGVLLMYDVSNIETLNSLRTWIDETKEYIEEDTPILLVGNKSASEENRDASEKDITKFKEDYNITSSIQISAETGENVKEMVKKITDMIFEK